MIRMNPDIGTDEMELSIIQCMDLRVGKDAKIFIEIEMPFPHVNTLELFNKMLLNLYTLASIELRTT